MTARWIVLDTSVFIAIILEEPEAERFLDILEYDIPRHFSAMSYLEASTVLQRSAEHRAVDKLDHLLKRMAVRIADFSAQHVIVARQAYRNYGKGSGHKAQLNFGDCAAYALAKILEAPLLFKGKDFAETDVMVA
jgi:ribonuclease VapC